MKIKFISAGLLALLLSISFNAGCSKGSGDEPAANTVTNSINGTAAKGAPLVNADVTVKDKNGRVKAATTDGMGKFSVDASDLTFPVIIMVNKSTDTVVTYCTERGAANATPFTTSIIGLTLRSNPALIDMTSGSPLNQDFSSIQGVTDRFMSVLKKICQADTNMSNLLGSFNLFTSPFVASGSGFDLILDVAKINVPDFSQFKVKVTVGGTAIDVDLQNIDSTEFSAIQSAYTTAAEDARLKNEKIVIFSNSYYDDQLQKYITKTYKMKYDGTGLEELTMPDGFTTETFHPIAVCLSGKGYFLYEYSSNAGNSNQDTRIVQYNWDGTNRTVLVEEDGISRVAFFSDGTRMVYKNSTGTEASIEYKVYSKSLTNSAESAKELYTAPQGFNILYTPEPVYDGNFIYSYGGVTGSLKPFRLKFISENEPWIKQDIKNTDFNDDGKIVHASRDGKTAVYIKETDDENYIYSGKITESGDKTTFSIESERQITTKESCSPRWTPDGRIIFIETVRDEGNDYCQHVCIINNDGSNKTDLTPDIIKGYIAGELIIQQ